jgi:hypothetical protein
MKPKMESNRAPLALRGFGNPPASHALRDLV